MADVVIRVRDSGPLLVEGAVTVFDADGKEFPIDKAKPAIALCRCGHSAKKPFCDGSHKTSGFHAAERAPSAG
jgi:CDGSH-type Zn-finger protein